MQINWQKIFSYGKHGENNLFWLVFFFLLLFIVSLSIWPVSIKNQQLQEKVKKLQEEIKGLKQKNERYQKEIDAVQKDPVYIEFLLRKKLRYGREGEKVIE